MDRRLPVLLLGETDRPEFSVAREQLERETELTAILRAADGAAWLASRETPPELIVLATARPGEISHRDVDALRRASPLSRLVGLLGSWCEGETRTGEPWPGVPRVYVHQWVARFDRELALRRSGRAPSWQTPETAGEDERLLSMLTAGREMNQEAPGAVRPRSICVKTSSAMRDLLTDVCRQAGLEVVAEWGDSPSPPAGVVFEFGLLTPAHMADIDILSRQIARAPLALLASCPRPETVQALQAAGVTVFSLPMSLLDLRAWLQSLARATG